MTDLKVTTYDLTSHPEYVTGILNSMDRRVSITDSYGQNTVIVSNDQKNGPSVYPAGRRAGNWATRVQRAFIQAHNKVTRKDVAILLPVPAHVSHAIEELKITATQAIIGGKAYFNAPEYRNSVGMDNPLNPALHVTYRETPQSEPETVTIWLALHGRGTVTMDLLIKYADFAYTNHHAKDLLASIGKAEEATAQSQKQLDALLPKRLSIETYRKIDTEILGFMMAYNQTREVVKFNHNVILHKQNPWTTYDPLTIDPNTNLLVDIVYNDASNYGPNPKVQAIDPTRNSYYVQAQNMRQYRTADLIALANLSEEV
jgi:hypothetical protein